jgi:hypothetical protein
MTKNYRSNCLGIICTLVLGACAGSPATLDGSDEGLDSSAETETAGSSDGTSTTDASGSSGADASMTGTPSGSGPVAFDLGTIPDSPPGTGCGGGETDEVKLSYIWIANSSQGTISKIDTETMVEEGRYQAKPSNGDPSRTSVNLSGDVAVANRNGGVAKFWADSEDCLEQNGVPGIQTSTGPNDVLAWGQEECLAWYTPMQCSSNRPVAWTRGVWDAATCSYQDAKLWTACDSQVLLLDGETGAVEEIIGLSGSPFVYGGAADADGNFWGLDTGSSRLLRVDGLDYSLQEWPLPIDASSYGITVDSLGRPWVCGGGGASRFNLDTSTWTSTAVGTGWGIGGCMTDGDSTLWHSDQAGLLLGFDIDSLAVVGQIPLPMYVHGISVDFYGNVWGVSFAGSTAYRADPMSGTVDTYAGLTGAYTYSDMTGHALLHAGGGGVPPG